MMVSMSDNQPSEIAEGEIDGRPVAVLTCGPAGAGKTTYAQALERQGYARLSHDVEVRRRFGRYGVDIPAERFEEFNDAVRPVVKERLADLLRQGRDIVVDLSFWRKADRDAYKAIVEAAGDGGAWSTSTSRTTCSAVASVPAARAGTRTPSPSRTSSSPGSSPASRCRAARGRRSSLSGTTPLDRLEAGRA
jgi:predicted kinase